MDTNCVNEDKSYKGTSYILGDSGGFKSIWFLDAQSYNWISTGTSLQI